MSEERIIDLEIRFAHQEATVEELTRTILRLEREVTQLQREQTRLRAQLKAALGEAPDHTPADP